MAIEVRAARPDEYADIGRITVDAYSSLRATDEWHAYLAANYAPHLRDVTGRARGALILAAVEGDEVLGGVTYVPSSDSPAAEFDDPAAAGIRMLAVSPDAQGRGAGRALVAACIERARSDGKSRVILHTQSFMGAASALYRSFGFERRSELDWSPAPATHLEGYLLDLG